MGDLKRFGRTGDALPDLYRRNLFDAQAKGDILEHRHVREQGQILKDHAEPALTRFQVVHHHIIDDDAATGRLLQPGDHV